MESVLGLVRHAGNDALLKAIEMSLLATASGQPLHLHAEGLRGTGKTTVMRAVRRALPRIRRIKGCLYNCDPAHPHCPAHRALTAEAVAALGDEWVPMPYLEISHSAKVGTVVGSIDLGRLVSPTQPEAALLPGTIPQAHRGIIFVDEINRLAETAPELADILLDVMGTKPGRVQIEETGLPAVELPVQVTVWAASNPDEDPGPLEDIRRQLSDRFDFVIYTDRPGDAAAVEAILDAAGGADWHRALSPADAAQADRFRADLDRRAGALPQVAVPQPLRQQLAEIYSRFNVESLRAVQAIQLGMRLAACLEGRSAAEAEDLARIAPLALRHRVDGETIKKVTAHLATLHQRPENAAPGAGMRQRFSNMSFGAAAVEASPVPEAPAVAPGGQGERRARDEEGEAGRPSGGQAGRRDWASQYPPRPQPDQSGWFSRTLQGLRRNLGMGAADPMLRPEPRAGLSAQHGAGAATENGQRASLTAPRPGRLFQRAELEQAGRQQAKPGARSAGAGEGSAGAGRMGEGGAGAGQAGSGASGEGGRAERSGAGGVMKAADPLARPPVAPPNPARPLASLAPHELIRTEEELGRR
jgi:magnesium chelatase subunit I